MAEGKGEKREWVGEEKYWLTAVGEERREKRGKRTEERKDGRVEERGSGRRLGNLKPLLHRLFKIGMLRLYAASQVCKKAMKTEARVIFVPAISQ